MKQNHIVYITDDNFAMPTCVSIQSLMCNNTSATKYQVHIVLHNVSPEKEKKFIQLKDAMISCDLIKVQEKKYKQLAKTCLTYKEIHVTETALYKFDLTELLPDVDKVLYLDGDVLVNKDISELFEIDISSYSVAAVDDMGDEKDETGTSKLAKRIGISKNCYFNSGVMLFNLKQMREKNVTKQLIKYRMDSINYFMDQDAFNKIMSDDRKPLPFCYNFRATLLNEMTLEQINGTFYSEFYQSLEACLEDQKIIHMTDKYKPWKYNLPWITNIFMDYYYKSPYQNEKLTLLSPLFELKERLKEVHTGCEWLNKRYEQLRELLDCKNWNFPYEQIEKGSKIILYGAGDVGRDFIYQLKRNGYCKVILWVDKRFAELGEEVESPQKIKEQTYDYVLISVVKEKLMYDICEELNLLGVPKEKIVRYDLKMIKKSEEVIK